MPHFLRSKTCCHMLRHGFAESALVYSFAKVEADLEHTAPQEGIDLDSCGCTTVSVLWSSESQDVWVATAGDCRAVLLAPGLGKVAETQDHRPHIVTERERVERSGGEVREDKCDNGVIERRVYCKREFQPSFAFTRSWGDLAGRRCGIVAEVEVARWRAPPQSLILAASDGVWEFLSTETVVDKVLGSLQAGRSHQETVNEILALARDAWRQQEDTYCDDITIALVSLSGKKSIENVAAGSRASAGRNLDKAAAGSCASACRRCCVS